MAAKRKRRKKSKQKTRAKRPSLLKSFLAGLISFTAGIFNFLFENIRDLPGKVKRYLLASAMFLAGLVAFLSFFDLSGRGGRWFLNHFSSLSGDAVYLAPFLFFLAAILFLKAPRRWIFASIISLFAFYLGTSGLFEILAMPFLFQGGRLGGLMMRPLTSFFGELVTFFVFLTMIVVGFFSLISILSYKEKKDKEKAGLFSSMKETFDASKFKVLSLEPEKARENEKETKEEPLIDNLAEAKGRGTKKSLPPFELLETEKEKSHPGDINKNIEVIKKTFEDFGFEIAMGEVSIGPTVTQYTFKPPEGVKLSKISGLSNNLALALAAHPIRIEAPIPGKSFVGIEVPNDTRSKVRLRDLLSDNEFRRKYSNLGFALGKDVAGKPVFTDVSRLPHLLVAGATGTGKTVFLNSFIMSLLYRNTPDTLRLILIDPKRVEFTVYRDLPHLLCEVICDSSQSISALSWLIEEMERRFKKLSKYNTRNIYSFNQKASQNGEEPLYSIVLIIDEMADLMVAKGKEMETKVVRIAQMARAVGIHLVLATQRPSTEVITGLIKANITCRVGFQVPTQIDSRTILDMGGCEKLLGAGDMLYVSPEIVLPRRLQGAYVSEEEVKGVTEWIKSELGSRSLLEDELSSSLKEFLEETEEAQLSHGGDLGSDPLYEQAKEIVIRRQKASASMLQRRLQIGYVRAARLLDMLEMDGVIGPSRGSKARKVFFKEEDEEEELYE